MIKISSILKEKQPEIDKIFDEIKYKINKGFYVIVEGKKDVRKLSLIGIEKNILPIAQKSIINFVESLPDAKGFIILTDFDRKGETMASRIYELLHVLPTEIDMKIRNNLKFYFKKFCKDIESIVKLYIKTKDF